jgi:two-component system NarL family sensor kinase
MNETETGRPSTHTPGAPRQAPPAFERAAASDDSVGAMPAMAGPRRGLAGVPLLQKLVVADLAINVAAYLLMRGAPPGRADDITVIALFGTLLLNAALVYFALLPLRALEGTAVRVAAGDLAARVPPSRFADRNVARIGRTLNALLDRLMADRARVSHLAAQVIGAADAERAHFARELHDSTAQQLSALEMLVAATRQELGEGATPALRHRLGVMHEIATEALAEVRTLSHRVHPGVLDHLGLAGALKTLARRTLEPAGVHAIVEVDDAPVTPAVASVLYRVAQEAMANAIRHGSPASVVLRLRVDAGRAELTVADDGAGFDVARAERERPGMGLWMMQERLMLVDGELVLRSRPGEGTTVRAVARDRAEAA